MLVSMVVFAKYLTSITAFWYISKSLRQMVISLGVYSGNWSIISFWVRPNLINSNSFNSSSGIMMISDHPGENLYNYGFSCFYELFAIRYTVLLSCIRLLVYFFCCGSPATSVISVHLYLLFFALD